MAPFRGLPQTSGSAGVRLINLLWSNVIALSLLGRVATTPQLGRHRMAGA